LRNAYLRIAPGLEPYFSTSPYDDERGLTASYLSLHGRGLRPWGHFLSNTATVIATVDAALAAAIAVLAVHKAGAATTLAVAVGAVAFLVVWTALFLLQRQSLSLLRRSKPRFPTPDESLPGPDRPYLRPADRPQGPHDQRADRLRPPAPAPPRPHRTHPGTPSATASPTLGRDRPVPHPHPRPLPRTGRAELSDPQRPADPDSPRRSIGIARASSVPERAAIRGLQRSHADSATRDPPGPEQADRLPETTSQKSVARGGP